jgi:predicted TIM-barrel fold metal-dependent hydrolase
VHGGWPLTGETQSLLSKPNVYADISAMVLFVEPGEVARVLRQWLGEWPEKVLFGTDAFDNGPEQGWAESAWLGTTTARRALALALTGMMRDGEISRARAELLARMVMRENAIAAYHLQ